jgi:hypothetical protein
LPVFVKSPPKHRKKCENDTARNSKRNRVHTPKSSVGVMMTYSSVPMTLHYAHTFTFTLHVPLSTHTHTHTHTYTHTHTHTHTHTPTQANLRTSMAAHRFDLVAALALTLLLVTTRHTREEVREEDRTDEEKLRGEHTGHAELDQATA